MGEVNNKINMTPSRFDFPSDKWEEFKQITWELSSINKRKINLDEHVTKVLLEYIERYKETKKGVSFGEHKDKA